MSGLFDQIVNYSPPLLTAGQVNYDGTWNAATNTPTLVSPPDALSKGDYYVVSAAGTQFGISFAVGDWIISNGTAWEKVDLTDAVSSVFGRTGAVVGDSSDYSAVGLTNTAIGAANPSTGAFTSLSSSSTTTLNGTTIPASKTLVVTTDKLSALAATTSAELAGVISDETGSGSLVFANSPTLVTPALGTPSALVGTNITGTAAAFNINGTVGATTPSTVAATSVTALSNSGYQAVVGQLTSGDRVGISGQASGSGAALVFFDNAQTTFRPAIFDASSHSLKISGVEKASVTSTGLQGAIGATTPSTGAFTTVSATTPIAVASGGTGVSTSTGTTNVVLSNSPTLVTPNLGTPQSGTLTSCTGLPISTGVSGLGTGVATALAVNVGSAGAPVVNGGALGTPSSGTVTNLTGTASININGTVGATTPSTGAFTTLSTSGNGTYNFGPITGSTISRLRGGNTATADGCSFFVDNGGTVVAALGNKSNVLGGAYNATAMLYNLNNLEITAGGTRTVGTFTSTGLNSTAIGATTPSTGAFTTLAIGTNAGFGGTLGQFNGSNVVIANAGGQFSIGTTNAAAADMGGSLGFTANTTSLAGYPMGSISARLIATGAGVYRSYMAFATTTSVGAVNEYMRLTDAGLAVTGALSSTGILSAPGFRASKTTASSGLVKIQDEGANVYNVIGSRNNADSAALPLDFQATSFAFNAPVDVRGNLLVGVSGTGTNIFIREYSAGTQRNWGIRDDFGVDRLRFSRGSSDYWFWDSLKVAGSDNVDVQNWRAVSGFNWTVSSTIRTSINSTGLAVTGALSCTGALSKGSGSFRIEHPLPEKSATHQLVHSFIEGPQADLIYRGKVVLVDGKASVNIDAAATMTEGTFAVLCRDVQCFTTNETGWTAVRGKVTGNILTIEAKDADCVDEISWMVIGERQDPHIMDTDWTDENGRPIVEPLKPAEPALESN